MKMPAVLNHQQFEDSWSEETEQRGLKRQQLYIYSNKEGKSLDGFEGKDKGEIIGYIPLLFIVFS